MLTPALLAARPASRRALLWLLAASIALQVLSVSIATAKGPAHAHRAPVAALVLEDVRRAGPARSVDGPEAEGWLGHHHGASFRHHHAAADPSLVLTEADRVADAAAESGVGAPDATVVVFVAVVMLLSAWSPASLSHRRAAHAAWQPSFETPRLIERPPQPA